MSKTDKPKYRLFVKGESSGLSERRLQSFTDERGRAVRGVFTAKRRLNALYTVKSRLTEHAKRASTRAGRDLLTGSLEIIRMKYPELETDTDAAWDFLNACRLEEECFGEERPSMKRLDPVKMAKYLAIAAGTDAETVICEIGAQNLSDLSEALAPEIMSLGLYIC